MGQADSRPLLQRNVPRRERVPLGRRVAPRYRGRVTGILIVNAAATWLMTGVIWIVQLVHYPLFARVGGEGFPAYHAAHSNRISLVVGPAMLTEAATAVLVAVMRPEGVAAWAAWLGVGLVAITWLATALLAVPQHGRLSTGFDAAAHRRLVAGNWVRTAAWSARGVLVAAMLASAVPG